MCLNICDSKHDYMFIAAISSLIISDDKSEVPYLNGDHNYKEWREKILLHLGYMDLDYALRKDEPPVPTESSTESENLLYERWERSNRLSLMFIKSRITTSIRGSIPECESVKDYMKAIDQQFETSNKSLASTMMAKLSSMKLTGIRGVRKHIMEMRDIAAQLKSRD